MACLSALRFVVVAMAIFPLLAAAALMDISNHLTYYDLEIQCESSTEHLDVNIIGPVQAYRFDFDPITQDYWHCTVVTSPKQHDPHHPIPFLWGKFFLYVRNSSFRPCTNLCSWIASDDGMSLILKPGDKPTHIYSWTTHH